MKIYILLEHPDMTYYGDAEIHAVLESREAVLAFAEEKGFKIGEFDNYSIEEWEITNET
jgi:hypothetical protein